MSIFKLYIKYQKNPQFICNRQTNQLMLLKDSVSIYCETHMGHVKTL